MHNDIESSELKNKLDTILSAAKVGWTTVEVETLRECSRMLDRLTATIRCLQRQEILDATLSNPHSPQCYWEDPNQCEKFRDLPRNSECPICKMPKKSRF
ncbi:hypothetical protein JWH11_08805 [Xanthomonas melonis]|uniref:Uncharacterized protein n=1 Tax=Xanthomonas melonis TaxID=56456 RepID=A0ABS8NTY2_9XANT|nr:hypothetical protein [Xanthomonas melonis]MCD0266537.1 hypothetical protein [Xanthomonas melonis]MCD0279943.1 hypothetical protein [Xanthomonas melonis]